MSDFPTALRDALEPVRIAFRQQHGDTLDGIQAAIEGVVNDWPKLEEHQRTQCIEYAKALMLSLGEAVRLAARRAISEALRVHGGTAAKALLAVLA